MKVVAVVLCLLFTVGTTYGQTTIDASFRVSNLEPLVGLPFTVTMNIVLPNGYMAELPELPSDWGSFQILQRGDRFDVVQDNLLLISQSYDVVAWIPGEYQTPDVMLQYQVNEQSEFFALPVRSVIITVPSVLDESLTLRPLKPAIDLPYPLTEAVLASAGVITVVLCTVVYIQRKRIVLNKRVPEQPTALDAMQTALNELNLLSESSLQDSERYTRTADILRWYIDQVLHIDAVEMTTDELGRALALVTSLSDSRKREIALLLEKADLVKFARHTPDGQRISKYIGTAQRWIRSSSESTLVE